MRKGLWKGAVTEKKVEQCKMKSFSGKIKG